MKARLLTVTAVAATVAAFAAATASALTVPATLLRAAALSKSPTCVSKQQMAQLTTSGPAGYDVYGLTDIPTRHVWLLNRICTSLENWVAKRPITTVQVYALVTLFHEAAHTRGIRSEQFAECDGVIGALFVVSGRPSDAWALPHVRHFLVVGLEKHRPPAYKLRGTCDVPPV